MVTDELVMFVAWRFLGADGASDKTKSTVVFKPHIKISADANIQIWNNHGLC